MSSVAIRLVLPCLAVAMLAGCASYYQIKNPANGEVYYTQSMSQTGQGRVKFRDDRSGSSVTIQNSEVSKISEQQYQEGLRIAAAKAVGGNSAPTGAAGK